MDNNQRYLSIYNHCVRTLTVDWRKRRKAIELPEDLRQNGRLYPNQRQFAEMAGISIDAYGRQERGLAQPSRQNFCTVMEIFDRYSV